jgi:starvation-inducible DNA-binding protein
VALGGIASGTTQAVADASTLSAYPTDITGEKEHVAAVADRLAAFAKVARAGIDTADLFAAMSRQLDKDLWLVEAHLR